MSDTYTAVSTKVADLIALVSSITTNILSCHTRIVNLKNYYSNLGQSVPSNVYYYENLLSNYETTFNNLKKKLQETFLTFGINVDLGAAPLVIGAVSVVVLYATYAGLLLMKEKTNQLDLQLAAAEKGLNIGPVSWSLFGLNSSTLLWMVVAGGAAFYLSRRK